MSYCTLDEAFNTDFLNNQNQECVKKQKVKRNKINCNAKKNRFNKNKEDLVLYSNYDPNHTFDNGLLGDSQSEKSYYANDYLGGFQLVEKFESSNNNRRNRHSNRSASPAENANNHIVENFESSNNNRIKVKRNNANNSSYEPNEVFEYSQEDNRPLPESSENYVIENSDDEDVEEEIIVKKRPKRKNTDELNSQISEINNKISFIMNQINKEDDESKTVSNPLENNIHDIILFVIFGAFIILLLESFFKFIVKIHARKLGL